MLMPKHLFNTKVNVRELKCVETVQTEGGMDALSCIFS
ncbi:MAG: hypothetical protein ACI88A_000573 [Paraglaciecola sp.]|jgi:hypothetical protein